MKNLIRSVSLCLLLAFASPAFSQHLRIYLTPPKLLVERVPPVVTGQVWTPGYYRFDEATNNYIWMPGTYQAPPQVNMKWVPPHYVRHHDYYYFVPGHWR